MGLKRSPTTIDLDADASARLDDYLRGRGAMKKPVLSKLVRWFIDRPDFIKDVVQGWVAGEMRQAYAAALRAMADELDDGAAHHDVSFQKRRGSAGGSGAP